MITQEATFYENYNIKTSSEYNEGVLVCYEEFNKQGNRILYEDINGQITKFEYDKKNRIKRTYNRDKVGNIRWKVYSYSKDNMTILHRREGNPPQIHKIVFGPEENGERLMISQKFL